MFSEKKHIVMYSGGLSSWITALRVVEKHGTENTILLFADVLYEDPDLYRFLYEGASVLSLSVTRICDGRTPWELFFQKRFIGNSRIDVCSEALKRNLLDQWRNRNCNPETDTIYIGMNYNEQRRIDRLRERVKPWRYEFPLSEKPWMDQEDMVATARTREIEPPRIYGMGFKHNNCGGACVKAGQFQWALLLEKNSTLYMFNEYMEQRFRSFVGKDVSILTDRRGGNRRPMTLKEFRHRLEGGEQPEQVDEWGCGCAV